MAYSGRVVTAGALVRIVQIWQRQNILKGHTRLGRSSTRVARARRHTNRRDIVLMMLLDHSLVTPDGARLVAVGVRKRPRLGLRDLRRRASQTCITATLAIQINHLLFLLLVTLRGTRRHRDSHQILLHILLIHQMLHAHLVLVSGRLRQHLMATAVKVVGGAQTSAAVNGFSMRVNRALAHEVT